MAVTTEQYNRILNRLTTLEETLNDLMVAMDKMVSLTQVNQLLVVISQQQEDLTERLVSLEDRVEIIEQEPLT